MYLFLVLLRVSVKIFKSPARINDINKFVPENCALRLTRFIFITVTKNLKNQIYLERFLPFLIYFFLVGSLEYRLEALNLEMVSFVHFVMKLTFFFFIRNHLLMIPFSFIL